MALATKVLAAKPDFLSWTIRANEVGRETCPIFPLVYVHTTTKLKSNLKNNFETWWSFYVALGGLELFMHICLPLPRILRLKMGTTMAN